MNSLALWYASRATGVVSLGLFTVVVLLGLMVNRKGRLPGLPRFAVTGLHRNLSLLAVSFLAVHVLSAVLDSYVHIGLLSLVVPFSSHYAAGWVGLGTVALDLMLALVLSSLLRARLSARVWRAIHWCAYAAWPLAVVHGVGTSKDLRHGVLLEFTVACIAVVSAAVGWRVAHATATAPVGRPQLAGGR